MKRNFLILISIISISRLFAQDFEGYILYAYQYLDASGKDITLSMGAENGMEQNYYIDSRNYKGIDEKGQLSQLYNSKSNTYFFQQGSKIRSFPGSTEYPKEFKYNFSKETLTVVGYQCNSVVVSTESGQTTYFYNNSISVNINNFENHRFGNWNNYLKATNGALPLKYIVKQKDFTLIATAVQVEQRNLDDSEFNIDKILKTKM